MSNSTFYLLLVIHMYVTLRFHKETHISSIFIHGLEILLFMVGLASPLSVTQPLIKSYLIIWNSIEQHNQVKVYQVKMNTSIRNNHDFIETLLGGAKYFNESQLPTIADVLRPCSMRRKELKNGSLEPK